MRTFSDLGRHRMTRQNGGTAAKIIKDLEDLEPIFHTRMFGTTLRDFEDRMVEDYWEIGASGRRWSRAEILAELAGRPLIWADQSGWRCSEHAVIDLGGDVHLFTYRLEQGERLSRRATIWRRNSGFWQILYHQGTLLAE